MNKICFLTFVTLTSCIPVGPQFNKCEEERRREAIDRNKISTQVIMSGQYRELRGILILKKDSTLIFRTSNFTNIIDSSGDSIVGIEYKGKWFNNNTEKFEHIIDSLKYFYISDSSTIYYKSKYSSRFHWLKASVTTSSFSLAHKIYVEEVDCDYNVYTFTNYNRIGAENNSWPINFNWNSIGIKVARVP